MKRLAIAAVAVALALAGCGGKTVTRQDVTDLWHAAHLTQLQVDLDEGQDWSESDVRSFVGRAGSATSTLGAGFATWSYSLPDGQTGLAIFVNRHLTGISVP